MPTRILRSEDVGLEVDILLNDTDNSGIDPTSVSIIRDVQQGNITVDATTGSITYVPYEHFYGIDSLIYVVQDSKGLVSNPATLVITVEPVNDTPVAVDDEATTGFRTVLNAPSVLTNDSDPVEGDSLMASLVSGPTQGTLVLNPDGTYVYTPDSLFSGNDSFVYQACDSRVHPRSVPLLLLPLRCARWK